MREPKVKKPKVFISYAWTSDIYVSRVAAFASSLQSIGIEVLFDKFELKPGNELNSFMERSVNDPTVTNVLLLLNKNYQEKADKREGGVGKETQIISEEVYNKVTQTKVIPVIFEKGPNGEVYKPTYLGSTYFVDLSDESKYDAEFKLLVKSIYGESIYRKPELGETPAWVTEEITFSVQKKLEIENIKKEQNKTVQKQLFKQALETLSSKLLAYDVNNMGDKENWWENYLDKCTGLFPYRSEYLELLQTSIYVLGAEKDVAVFLETLYNRMNVGDGNKEILLTFLHEIFLYTIAFYIKSGLYKEIGYLLGRTYFANNYRNDNVDSYSIFYSSHYRSNFDKAVKARDNKNYISGTAAFWVENLDSTFCSKQDFVLADNICFNYMLFGDKDGKHIHWFPLTYIYEDRDYNCALKKIGTKLRSKEQLEEVLLLFNYTKEEFIAKYIEVEKARNEGKLDGWGYQESFYSAPLLCEFVKSSEIGQYR